MNKEARELAELMGWESNEPHNSDWITPDGGAANYVPAYDTDLNAMREVWKVLWERGLWEDFRCFWRSAALGRGIGHWDHKIEYRFLNDLPGQVQAAIKVLK